MPSSQPKAPLSPTKKHHPILTKTISGEISKKTKKPIFSAKSPSAKSPTQFLRRPSGKQRTALLRGLQTVEKQNVSKFRGPAVPVSERMDVETPSFEPEKDPMNMPESMDIETKPSTIKIVKKPASKKTISGGISKKTRKASLSLKSASKSAFKSPFKSPSKSTSTSPSTSPSATSSTTSSKSPSNPSPDRHLHRPNGKFAPLIRMIQIIGIQNVQRCCEPDEMDTVSIYSLPPMSSSLYTLPIYLVY
ncbi:hypothetical protein OCU04_002016 [Sclerotinia nivalis]|uniref:Uncharacterized protein n=1 Tax=Sclerotinia nivalis TaxID=352851 RepID=A0A9X0AZ95_9HELO|nr:hypothetical protein OCU04_002016 [Sclerotinia nivalis]